MGGVIRMTYPTAMVLQALEAGLRYGFEIAETVGLRPGSVYQVLRRLEDAGAVEGRWEEAERAHEQGRPPRRYYRLVPGEAEPLMRRALNRYPSLDGLAAEREGVVHESALDRRSQA